jgi:hypothetical protein
MVPCGPILWTNALAPRANRRRWFCRVVVGWGCAGQGLNQPGSPNAKSVRAAKRPSGPWYLHCIWFVPALYAKMRGLLRSQCTRFLGVITRPAQFPSHILSFVFFFSLHPSFHPNNPFLPAFSPISLEQRLGPTTTLASLPAPTTPSSILARHTAAACNSSPESAGPW